MAGLLNFKTDTLGGQSFSQDVYQPPWPPLKRHHSSLPVGKSEPLPDTATRPRGKSPWRRTGEVMRML